MTSCPPRSARDQERPLLIEPDGLSTIWRNRRAPGRDAYAGIDHPNAPVTHQRQDAGRVERVDVVPSLLVWRPAGEWRLVILSVGKAGQSRHLAAGVHPPLPALVVPADARVVAVRAEERRRLVTDVGATPDAYAVIE